MTLARSVANLLALEARGRENAITSKSLMARLHVEDGEGQPKTRELVREATERFNLPVAGSGHGYYVVTNVEELEDYLASLDSRIAGIEERKVLVCRAWNRPQPTFADRRVGVRS